MELTIPMLAGLSNSEVLRITCEFGARHPSMHVPAERASNSDKVLRDFKDPACSFFEAYTYIYIYIYMYCSSNHFFCAVFCRLAILRIEGCLNSTL